LSKHLERGRIVKYSHGNFIFSEDTQKFSNLEIPLIGFSEIPEEKKIMKKEGITHKDFIIKQIPELSLEGGMRKAVVKVTDLVIGKIEDKKVKISFSLPKGSYATMVVKKIIL